MRAWCCSAKSPAETPPWRRLERSVERRLDAPPDTEEVTIAAVLANDHQPEGRTHRPYRHGNCAAIEEIDNRRVRSPVSAFRWCHEDRLADEKKIFGRVRANPTKRWRRLDVSLGIGATGSHVPYKSLVELRAVYKLPPSERKQHSCGVIVERMFNRSRVDRGSQLSRVTISTSPAPS
jgi:hypothetical protein